MVSRSFVASLIKARLERQWIAYMESINFVDSCGRIVRELDDVNKESLSYFYEVVNAESKRFLPEIDAFLRKEMPSLSSSALAFLQLKYAPSETPAVVPIKVPKGVPRIVDKIDEVLAISRNIQSFYLAVAPHTFCFAPFTEADYSGLEAKIRQKFLKGDFRNISGNAKSAYVFAYEQNDFIVTLRLYASTDTKKPDIQLKMRAQHAKGSLTDVLDVVGLFKPGGFKGISHYHVEKKYTQARLGISNPESAYRVEISRLTQANKASCTVEDMDGPQKIFVPNDDFEGAYQILKVWDARPIVAGGALFQAAFEVIIKEPKFIALMYSLAKTK